jgi:hypothetical protein
MMQKMQQTEETPIENNASPTIKRRIHGKRHKKNHPLIIVCFKEG